MTNFSIRTYSRGFLTYIYLFITFLRTRDFPNLPPLYSLETSDSFSVVTPPSFDIPTPENLLFTSFKVLAVLLVVTVYDDFQIDSTL